MDTLLKLVRCLLLAGLIAAPLAGCRTARTVTARQPEAPEYKHVHLVYEMNGKFRSIPVDDVPVSQASFDKEGTCGRKWSAAQLTLEFPHPEGIPSMARATLRLSSRKREHGFQEGITAHPGSGSNKFFELTDFFRQNAHPPAPPLACDDDEIWVLDVPRSQLDLLLMDLGHGGYFEMQVRSQPGTRLELAVDKTHLDKQWGPEPRLDDFVNRVYAGGQLSGFVTHDSLLPTMPVGSLASSDDRKTAKK